MKRLIFLSLSIFLPFIVYTQDKELQQYDSIMTIMKDKSIPLLERYYMTGDIEHLSREHQIDVMKQLIPEAKSQEDKAVVTRLYSIISLFKTQLSDMEIAKNYLDSAFIYDGKFANNNISGMMHYVAGNYYMAQTDFVEAQKNYYKAAEYFNKNEQKPSILTDVYYNLSTIYILWKDEKGLAELMKDMEYSPVDFPFQHILKLTIQSQYYYTHYRNTENTAYLDSAAIYNNLAFDVYNTTDNPYDVGYQIADNYLSQALIYCLQGKIAEAQKCLNTGQKLINPKLLDSDARILFVSGTISFYLKDYSKAEKYLLSGLQKLETLSEEKKINYDESISSCYQILAQIYEEQNLYDKALVAERKSIDYATRLNNKNNRKEINTLRVKYNLDQAERNVKQLSVLNEQRKRVNLLAIGMIILALITIILLVVRYRSRQKLNAHLLQIAELKQQEADLMIELQKSKLEEKENEFQAILNESKQRHVQSYLEGLEAERERLATELHDDVCNSLMALEIQIRTQHAKQEDTAPTIVETLAEIRNRVRTVSHELMPPTFQYATLDEMLEDFITHLNLPEVTETEYRSSPGIDWNNIPSEIGFEFYRITQEAINNAIKYASAHKISVELKLEDHQLSITIEDDGKGFDTKKKTKGIGLHTIAQRIQSIKGTFELTSHVGTGTKIVAKISLG